VQRQLEAAVADQHLGVLAVDLVDEREVALAGGERRIAVQLLLAREERVARGAVDAPLRPAPPWRLSWWRAP